MYEELLKETEEQLKTNVYDYKEISEKLDVIIKIKTILKLDREK